jgi:hypothetical protein
MYSILFQVCCEYHSTVDKKKLFFPAAYYVIESVWAASCYIINHFCYVAETRLVNHLQLLYFIGPSAAMRRGIKGTVQRDLRGVKSGINQ